MQVYIKFYIILIIKKTTTQTRNHLTQTKTKPQKEKKYITFNKNILLVLIQIVNSSDPFANLFWHNYMEIASIVWK